MANANFIVKVKWDQSAALVRKVAELLEESPRMGSDEDRPEGVRYIQISDTLAASLANELRHLLTVDHDSTRL